MGGTRKEAREDAADRAAALVGGWLHRRGLRVEEALSGRLNAWIKVRRDEGSPGQSTLRGGMRPFPCWDWSGSPVPRDEAWLRTVAWLFGDGDMTGPKTVETQSVREAAPGWIQTTTDTSRIPKFRFSSLEEFILKAEASGEFA